jgi:DegV family protein with EDD domain
MPSIDAFLPLFSVWRSGQRNHLHSHSRKTEWHLYCCTLAAEASPVPVMVVDTQTTAMGRALVLEAARAAQKGARGGSASAALAVVPKVEVVALLETINYAIQGGRLKQAARLLGNLLNIHPLVRVAENSVSLVGQVRRYGKGVQQLVDRVIEQAGAMPTHLAVHYSEDHSLGQTILDELKQRSNCVEAYLSQIPVPLGAHAGPGSVGIATYIEKEQKPGLSPLQRLMNR